jgi:glycosyltransferase involved in cell wall biosynthesis
MKVSLITVTYNAAKHLEECIQSVVSQDYLDIEYIIIDGQSTDHTISIINQHKGSIDKWSSEKDYGMYDALNKGMRMATGDIIGVLNSDDMLASKDAISKIVACFKEKNVDSVFGDLMYVEEQFPFWMDARASNILCS